MVKIVWVGKYFVECCCYVSGWYVNVFVVSIGRNFVSGWSFGKFGFGFIDFVLGVGMDLLFEEFGVIIIFDSFLLLGILMIIDE